MLFGVGAGLGEGGGGVGVGLGGGVVGVGLGGGVGLGLTAGGGCGRAGVGVGRAGAAGREEGTVAVGCDSGAGEASGERDCSGVGLSTWVGEATATSGGMPALSGCDSVAASPTAAPAAIAATPARARTCCGFTASSLPETRSGHPYACLPTSRIQEKARRGLLSGRPNAAGRRLQVGGLRRPLAAGSRRPNLRLGLASALL